MSDLQFPQIDTTSLETWGKTFAARVIAYVEAHKKGEHGDYDLPNFSADTYVGDLPWDSDNEIVIKFAEEVPGYKEAYDYLLTHPEYIAMFPGKEDNAPVIKREEVE